MQKLFLMLFTSIALFSNEQNDYSIIDYSFITKSEYGEMLYKNPRGIGCNKCHGDKAQGLLIAKYKNNKDEEIKLTAPNISNVSWEVFKKTLNDKSDASSVMPTYFLTNEELESIHFYIKNMK